MKSIFKKSFAIFSKNFVTILVAALLIIIPLWAVQFFCIDKTCDISNAMSEFNNYLVSEEAKEAGSYEAFPAEIR